MIDEFVVITNNLNDPKFKLPFGDGLLSELGSFLSLFSPQLGNGFIYFEEKTELISIKNYCSFVINMYVDSFDLLTLLNSDNRGIEVVYNERILRLNMIDKKQNLLFLLILIHNLASDAIENSGRLLFQNWMQSQRSQG